MANLGSLTVKFIANRSTTATGCPFDNDNVVLKTLNSQFKFPLPSHFPKFALPRLSSPPAVLHIRRRFRSVGITIKNIDKVLNVVEGHPEYTQRFCSHLYDIITASSKQLPLVQLDEVLIRKGIKAMIEGCEMIFIPEWQTFPLRQQQALSVFAEKGPLRRVAAVDLAEYEITHTSFNTALKQLLRKGALREDENRNYYLVDPIFRRWIAGRSLGYKSS